MQDSPTKDTRRRFVGIMFDCCEIYGRLYVNKQRTAFEGRCPRCYRKVSVPASEDGIDTGFLRG